MANRDIGIGVIGGYMLFFWGCVAAFLVWITSNTAPGAPQLEWKDEETFTTTKLSVELATPSVDRDGDPITYSYTWTVDGEPVENEVSKTISSRSTVKGETWEVTVVPDDGTRDGWGCNLPWRECAGGASAKLAVTIANTPPRARLRFRDAEENELEEFQANQDVRLDLSCFDPDFIDAERRRVAEAPKQVASAASGDGDEAAQKPEKVDPCTYTVAWWPADAEIEEGAEPPFTGLEMSAKDLKTSTAWKVIVVANDGEDDSEELVETFRRAES